MKFETPNHYHDTYAIITAALALVGVKSSEFIRAMGLRETDPKTAFDINFLSVTDWMKISNALCLHCDCVSYGYTKTQHKFMIGRAYDRGDLRLPKTPQINAILQEYRANHS